MLLLLAEYLQQYYKGFALSVLDSARRIWRAHRLGDVAVDGSENDSHLT